MLYPIPRDIPSLSNPSDKRGGGRDDGQGSRRGSGGRGEDYWRGGPNDGGGSGDDVKMFRLGSWKGQDEWAPLSAEVSQAFGLISGGKGWKMGFPPRSRDGVLMKAGRGLLVGRRGNRVSLKGICFLQGRGGEGLSPGDGGDSITPWIYDM